MNRVVTTQPTPPPHNVMNEKSLPKRLKGRIATFIAKAQKRSACTHCKKTIQRDELILTAKRARSRDLVGIFCPPTEHEEGVRVGQQEVKSPCFIQYLTSSNQ